MASAKIILEYLAGIVVIAFLFVLATGIHLNLRANDFREPADKDLP